MSASARELPPYLLSGLSRTEWLAIAATILLTYAVAKSVYNLYFHPAAKFPGPWYTGISNAWFSYHRLKGRWPWEVDALLNKYGDAVRVAPNEVIFRTTQAARDVYTPAVKNQETWVKTDLLDFGAGDGGFIWEQDPARRKEVGKKILPAFSAKAIRAKEPTVHMYIDAFVDKMKKIGSTPQGVEIDQWMLWLSMDLSADLAYGRELHHMRDTRNTDFLETMLGTRFFGTLFQVSKKFPLLSPLMVFFVPPKLLTVIPRTMKMNSQEVQRRIDNRGNTKHPDFVDYMVPADSPAPTTKKEKVHLEQIALQLFIAGFEPIQLAFYGSLFLLLKEPTALATLVEEIRSTFKSYDEITPESLAKLEYLNACINETLRVQITNTTGMPRKSPGAMVNGVYVPKGITCQVSLFSVARDPRCFHDPKRYRPERWLSPGHPKYDPVFANDDTKGFFPFGLGPRMCSGKEIAWHQSRLFLGKVLYTFDLECVRGNEKTFDNDFRVYVMWEKPQVWVRFLERKH